MTDRDVPKAGPADASRAAAAERHLPVLLGQVLAALKPVDGETYIDATFGAGGYSQAILRAADCTVMAMDRDRAAIEAGRALQDAFKGRLTLSEGRFSQMARIASGAGLGVVDGVVLDIGVSSMQLDEAARGFSFQRPGPLDMRMSAAGPLAAGPTAADVVNAADEGLIADILYYLGGERRSRAIARAIARARGQKQLTTTADLVAAVAEVLGAGRADRKHPATRTFQALRIYVNDELGELAAALGAAEALLAPGGRLVVVSFHSLEDRIVKRFFAARTGRRSRGSRHLPADDSKQRPASFQFVNPQPVSPSRQETSANPRARSARMRWAVRTEAAAWPFDDAEIVGPRCSNTSF